MPTTALIVDDEPSIRRALRNALREDFERIVEASNAEEAVDLAAAHRPELVILSLFEPFFRCARTGRRRRGTGLGLAIARSLAEAQGGSVSFGPREGGGSTFTLRLPREELPPIV